MDGKTVYNPIQLTNMALNLFLEERENFRLDYYHEGKLLGDYGFEEHMDLMELVFILGNLLPGDTEKQVNNMTKYFSDELDVENVKNIELQQIIEYVKSR
ncbi:MAG: hypothetical protein KAS04_05870 [Candidatus Aenigmarchaeota archaeon]|nr:hypothetical protein [Candidatus Aenigmarchaeota archaeon]